MIVADVLDVDSGVSGSHTVRDLVDAHLQAEDAHGLAVFCSVKSDVEGESGFAETGSGGEHDHVGAVEAAEHTV